MSATDAVNALKKLSGTTSQRNFGSGASLRGSSAEDNKINMGNAMEGLMSNLLLKASSSAQHSEPQPLETSMSRSRAPLSRSRAGCADGDLACQLTGSGAAPAPLAGSRSLFVSTSRRGNTDMRNTGIVPFSVTRSTVVNAGDGNAYNSMQAPKDISAIDCTDCSAVGEDEFMQKCVIDSNLSSALMRFSDCQTSANRRINQDAGSRQIDSQSQRDGTQHNLTSTKTPDSSLAGSGAMYRSRALFSSRDPAGGLGSAEQQNNANPL